MNSNTGLSGELSSQSPSEQLSQSPSEQLSQSPSEAWLHKNTKSKVPKRHIDSDKSDSLDDSENDEQLSDNDVNDDNEDDDNDLDPFPQDDGSGPSPESTLIDLIEGTSFTYSRTSDHKPVYMKFYLEGISEPIVALTYNMSFASDLGLAMGSEKNFVARAISEDSTNPRAYWINAAELVVDFVKTQNPTIMYFQEMNDQLKIREKKPTFNGGYQALLELLANPGTISYNDTHLPCTLVSSMVSSILVSYYKHGTYTGIDGKFYGFLAYSIEKKEPWGTIYPTVLTIWNSTILGDFANFYGNDLGLHPKYGRNPFHYGRNFSCISTSNGANLINLHGPNDPFSVKTKLKPAIEDYMTEAATNFKAWNAALTVIGGDTNDTNDLMKTIKYNKTLTFYKYRGDAPKSCCAEFFNSNGRNDTLNKDYVYSGDKFLVKKFNSYLNNPLFNKNILYKPIDPIVIYGGRRYSRNIKKKKSLKKRKTIKKRHYKLKNKKSFKKRRIFRRKTRKHIHINNNVIL
jgi:hypothetical protein